VQFNFTLTNTTQTKRLDEEVIKRSKEGKYQKMINCKTGPHRASGLHAGKYPTGQIPTLIFPHQISAKRQQKKLAAT
jgi:hypothetical protein